MVAAMLSPAAYAVDTGDIVVTSLRGEVHITVNGVERTLKAGGVLDTPSSIQTGRDGAIELKQGATGISVGPDTLLEFPAQEKRGGPIDRIVQPRGNAFYGIGKRTGGNKLRVETPYLVGVIKGTQFNVAAQEDSTTISLFEGRLEVHAADESDVVDLNAGEIATRKRGAKNITVLKMDGKAPTNAPRPASQGGANAGGGGPAMPAPIAPTRNESDAGGKPLVVGNTGVNVDVNANANVAATTGLSLDVRGNTANLNADVAVGVADTKANVGVGVNAGATGVGANTSVSVGNNGVAANVGAAVAAPVVNVTTNTNVAVTPTAVDLGTSTGVAAGPVAVNTGATAAVQTGSTGIAASVNAASSASLGATPLVGTSTSVAANLGTSPAVTVSTAASTPVVATSTNVSTNIATTPAVTVNTATTTPVIDTSASVATNLTTTPAATVNTATTVPVVQTGIAAAVNATPGTVDIGLNVAGTTVNAGADLGTTSSTTTTTSSTTTATPAPTTPTVDLGTVLDGLLRRKK